MGMPQALPLKGWAASGLSATFYSGQLSYQTRLHRRGQTTVCSGGCRLWPCRRTAERWAGAVPLKKLCRQ